MSYHFKHRVFGLPKGSVTVEFAIIVAFILPVLIFGIIDLGMFVWTRQVMTEVSRLGGGKVFARDKKCGYIDIYDANDTKNEILLNLLEDAGGHIFDDNVTKWKIIVSQITAEKGSDDLSTPWDDQIMYISKQIHRGELDVNSTIGNEGQSPPNQEALPHIYSHLEYDSNQTSADKSELGVVEVFYKYEPITPLPNFIEGILQMDGGGVIIRNCKAFF